MKSQQVNRLMYAAGALLLAALAVYLFNGNQIILDGLLITASIVAGVPTVLRAWQASRQKMFSIELLVTIAVIGALIIGEYVESAAVTFLFPFGAFLEGRSLEKARASLKSLMKMARLEATVFQDAIRSSFNAEEV